MSKIDRAGIRLNLEAVIPDGWVILKIDDEIPFYKVFASFNATYTTGQSYRLNSGIRKVDFKDERYYFYGYSGSLYICYKNRHNKLNSYAQSILKKLTNLDTVSLIEDQDWTKLIAEKE